MSDLISRSELLKAMDTWDKFGYDEHNRLIKIDRTNKEYVPYVHYEDMVKCVNDIPTAYDVDKVVEELEGAMWLTTNDDGETNNLSIQVVSFEDAIEIVQEVAEEYTSTEHINYSTNASADGWIPIKTRPMTEEEKEYYSEYLFEGNGLIYECPLPDDGQEVLITSKYGSIDKTTFYTDCGNYFENYEDYDEVIAWQSLPQPYKESE